MPISVLFTLGPRVGKQLPVRAAHTLISAVTHCGGEEAARLELLQTHGAGVGPKEQDEGHQGDVRHVATGLSDQPPSVLQTLLPAQGRPGGIYWLERQGQKGAFNQQAMKQRF